MIDLLLWLSLTVPAHTAMISQEPPAEPQPGANASNSSAEETRPLDARIHRAVARVIREGVVLFNEQRDPAGCYRLYQGALIGFLPLLDHHRALQDDVKEGLDRADGLFGTDAAQAALELRRLLDRTHEATRGEPIVVRSLWDRLGGEEVIRAVVHDFVALAAGDEEVNFFRDGQFALDTDRVDRLEQLMVEYFSAATGGPLPYTGRPMGLSHEGMGITDEEFNALAADLVAVLRKYDIPQADADELLAIVAKSREEIVEVTQPQETPRP